MLISLRIKCRFSACHLSEAFLAPASYAKAILHRVHPGSVILPQLVFHILIDPGIVPKACLPYCHCFIYCLMFHFFVKLPGLQICIDAVVVKRSDDVQVISRRPELLFHNHGVDLSPRSPRHEVGWPRTPGRSIHGWTYASSSRTQGSSPPDSICCKPGRISPAAGSRTRALLQTPCCRRHPLQLFPS